MPMPTPHPRREGKHPLHEYLGARQPKHPRVTITRNDTIYSSAVAKELVTEAALGLGGYLYGYAKRPEVVKSEHTKAREHLRLLERYNSFAQDIRLQLSYGQSKKYATTGRLTGGNGFRVRCQRPTGHEWLAALSPRRALQLDAFGSDGKRVRPMTTEAFWQTTILCMWGILGVNLNAHVFGQSHTIAVWPERPIFFPITTTESVTPDERVTPTPTPQEDEDEECTGPHFNCRCVLV